MAITTKNLLNSKYWREPRKYSKAEALLYLINRPSDMSVRHLAMAWQWSRSSVERFILDLKKERLWDTFWDTFRDAKRVENKQVAQNVGTQSGTVFGTHNYKDNNTPPILSTTNVVSNIFPPKGESESANPDFIEFQRWIEENAPRVAKMKEPFTEAQFFALRTDFDAQFSCDLLKSMHNYEPLLTKNRSANLTFRNWAKRRKQDDTKRTTNTPSDDPKSRLEGVLRAAAEGISRANTSQEWESRAVGL